MRSIHVNSKLLVIGCAALIGLISGAAVAANTIPAGVASSEGGAPGVAQAPHYSLNESGQTYGSLSDAVSPEDEPDLILVRATNGLEGYVLREALNQATGANVATPEEAIAWQQTQDAIGWTTKTIPVYESDGQTQIGEFEITRSIPNYEEP